MDFGLSTRAFVGSYFKLNTLTGPEKFLVAVASLSNGDKDRVVSISTVRSKWTKGTFKIQYDGHYYADAQTKVWVKSEGYGKCSITQGGLDHLNSISTNPDDELLSGSAKLFLFSSQQSHSFDKFLRETFGQATKRVRIADSYVDATIFDNVLDNIPTTAKVELMYGNNPDSIFDARVKRFRPQYKGFTLARNSHLHDRFIIVDEVGFIVGPSIKDAAVKNPAIVVRLDNKDSKRLIDFFDNQYKNLTKS